mmetsp:Transcript_98720/g.274706  ORF Transcript_98720/g.274706 Transcript_98720/m.274706 type:complete len:204 (+) Transcript_98720:724-1335(+)
MAPMYQRSRPISTSIGPLSGTMLSISKVYTALGTDLKYREPDLVCKLTCRSTIAKMYVREKRRRPEMRTERMPASMPETMVLSSGTSWQSRATLARRKSLKMRSAERMPKLPVPAELVTQRIKDSTTLSKTMIDTSTVSKTNHLSKSALLFRLNARKRTTISDENTTTKQNSTNWNMKGDCSKGLPLRSKSTAIQTAFSRTTK